MVDTHKGKYLCKENQAHDIRDKYFYIYCKPTLKNPWQNKGN